MKKYFALIFCLLLSIGIGISCQSSDSADNDNNTTKTKTESSKTNTNTNSAIPEETKERIEANKTAKKDERIIAAMMKRAGALAKTYCKCSDHASKEKCETRIQKSFDATLKRLDEEKHEEFKKTYNDAIAACK